MDELMIKQRLQSLHVLVAAVRDITPDIVIKHIHDKELNYLASLITDIKRVDKTSMIVCNQMWKNYREIYAELAGQEWPIIHRMQI